MQRAEQIEINRNQIQINPEEIRQYLGAQEDENDPYTSQVIRSQIERCLEIIDPQGGYARFPAVHDGSKNHIAIPGTTFHTGKIIGEHLHTADEFVFFMGTAGPDPEALSRSLLEKGDYLKGMVTDIIASTVAEAVAEQLHRHIMEIANRDGLHATNRYSPGYCNWKVSEQQLLFTLLPEGFCGIVLSESSLMSPIKSVSGVVGIGSEVLYSDYICDDCNMKNCAYRKKHSFYRRS